MTSPSSERDLVRSCLRCSRCAAAGGGMLGRVDEGRLRCETCFVTYPVQDGTPVMLRPATDFLGILAGERQDA